VLGLGVSFPHTDETTLDLWSRQGLFGGNGISNLVGLVAGSLASAELGLLGILVGLLSLGSALKGNITNLGVFLLGGVDIAVNLAGVGLEVFKVQGGFANSALEASLVVCDTTGRYSFQRVNNFSANGAIGVRHCNVEDAEGSRESFL